MTTPAVQSLSIPPTSIRNIYNYNRKESLQFLLHIFTIISLSTEKKLALSNTLSLQVAPEMKRVLLFCVLNTLGIIPHNKDKNSAPIEEKKNNVLYEITRLNTGLRGVPVGTCSTSSVDPLKGLSYVGYPINDVAYWEPERVIYLLFYGKDCRINEFANFKQELQNRAHLSQEFIEEISKMSPKGDPMALFSMAITALGRLESSNDYKEDCLNLIAKIPLVAALVINHHAGWGATPQSNPELDYIVNFVHMLLIPSAKKDETFIQLMKLFNILHYDHDGGNLSTFVGKAVASGLANIYLSIAAAMNALAGARHGGANRECLNFLDELSRQLGDDPTDEAIEHTIRDKLSRKELIYGFGHAVLRVEDPRATILYEHAQTTYNDNAQVKLALKLRNVAVKVLKENPKISNPYPNVDAISGAVLQAAGFPPEYITLIFGLSRIVGIAIQIRDEREDNVPIMRPQFNYKERNQSAKK